MADEIWASEFREATSRLFGKQADGSYALPPPIGRNDDIPVDLLLRLESLGMAQAVLNSSFISVVEETLVTIVRAEACRLTLYALEKGRMDLTTPGGA